jgi:1-acyl-sn-glycerol-3-phosphate acyltransferase
MLKEDKASVGVFPEGKISDDRKLHRFRPGVFKIAQKAQVPIVVCTLKNTNHVIDNLPKFKPSFVEMTVLETIPVEEITGIPTTEIAERIYQMMAADLGPENVSDED